MNIENSFKIYGLDRLIQVTLSCIVNKKLQHIRDIYIYIKNLFMSKSALTTEKTQLPAEKEFC